MYLTVPQYVFAWRASLDGPVGSCRAVFARNCKGFAALQSLSTEVQDTSRLCSNSIKGRRFDVSVHIGAHNVAD